MSFEILGRIDAEPDPRLLWRTQDGRTGGNGPCVMSVHVVHLHVNPINDVRVVEPPSG